MDKQLLARRQKAENSFNDLQKQKEQKQQEIENMDTEMARLQGEWRLLNDLIDKENDTKKKTKVSPKAEVLDLTDVEGA